MSAVVVGDGSAGRASPAGLEWLHGRRKCPPVFAVAGAGWGRAAGGSGRGEYPLEDRIHMLGVVRHVEHGVDLRRPRRFGTSSFVDGGSM